jgi:dTDP-4-dehydrorhamnose 3,5-epimerase
MHVSALSIPDLLLIRPTVFRDHRGTFFESWHEARFREHGLPQQWVQDNVAISQRGVLRGLHFQAPHAQAKLVSVLAGEIYDVAVDVRRTSPTFGRWCAVTMSAGNAHQLFVPAGFAHGYVVLSDEAIVGYKCTAAYRPECEHALRWNDPDLAIAWPIEEPVLSAKDAAAMSFAEWRTLSPVPA